jgi:CDGSH-type Zn-finger protein/uncharacterized Fe-S cluster protein YjdI
MATSDESKQRIVVIKNGPYHIYGGVPVVHKTQVVSEHGEPLTWKKEETLEAGDDFILCRCGRSTQMPFCDLTHRRVPFDGTESADTGVIADRQMILPGGVRLVVKKDPTLCMESGFCGMRDTTLEQLVAASDDTQARALAIAMVERCPSGALTYQIEPGEPDIEPDLPRQIAATTEITSDGPIVGPLWVSGGIPIERSDGQPLEVRNRVTLCNCGLARNKPFCDGEHRHEAERIAREGKGA